MFKFLVLRVVVVVVMAVVVSAGANLLMLFDAVLSIVVVIAVFAGTCGDACRVKFIFVGYPEKSRVRLVSVLTVQLQALKNTVTTKNSATPLENSFKRRRIMTLLRKEVN